VAILIDEYSFASRSHVNYSFVQLADAPREVLLPKVENQGLFIHRSSFAEVKGTIIIIISICRDRLCETLEILFFHSFIIHSFSILF
jgi:hypothetical protein